MKTKRKEVIVFDKLAAEKHLKTLLKCYKIKVVKYRTTSSGRANCKKKEIQIPHPTNADRFAVCMHEVKHILDGNVGKRFEQEFACDLFARKQMVLLKMGGIEEWDRRMAWHCLSRIAMAVNRGLKISSIPNSIKKWFKEINFKDWEENKVFVRYCPESLKGYVIELTDKIKTIN